MIGPSALMKENPESSVTPSTTSGHSEKLVIYNPEKCSCHILAILAP